MVMVETPAYSQLSETYGLLVSVSMAAPGVTVRHFLRAARGSTRFLWADRDGQTTFAGVGSAAELTAWGEDRFHTLTMKALALFNHAVHVTSAATEAMEGRKLRPGARLFGGFSFQDDFMPDNTWTIYAPAYFVLPHYQLARYGSDVWLTLNTTLSDDEEPEDVLPHLREALEARYASLVDLPAAAVDAPMHAVERNYPMSYDTWARIITDATARIQAGDLQKVVLSRVCEIRFAEQVNVDAALDYLDEHYPNSYRFLFEPRPHHAFYGATPELLARVNGARIETMGLAGSIRRGAMPDEDSAYGQQLLNDPKERLEHALVVDAIQAKLAPITDQLRVPDAPGLYKLSNIQHLYTPVEGTLKANTRGILPIIKLLHPTPALGGQPREAAMQFIREAEPVPRGWYAAPIGWIDHKLDGAFGVAIRSAVSQDRRVWLYAGAGIVGDSIPQKEWDETALKFKPMLNALGIHLNR